jgi:hypothetical protein
MGAASTMEITRSDCVSEIIKRLFTASDDKLESVLLDLYEQRELYNFQIVVDYSSDWYVKYSERGL